MNPPRWLRKLVVRLLAGGSQKRVTTGSDRIAIFKVDRIGDFIMALGAIRKITGRFGESSCTLIVHRIVGTLARKEFPGAEVVELSEDCGGAMASWHLFQADGSKLKRLRFKKLICLRHQRNLIHHVALSWIQADEIVGLVNNTEQVDVESESLFRFPLANGIPLPQAISHTCLELENHRTVIEAAMGEHVSLDEIVPKLTIVQPQSGNYIYASPFSSDPNKDYPREKLIQALVAVQKQAPLPIVVSGPPSDQARLNKLGDEAAAAGIQNFQVKKTDSLASFCDLVAGAALVYSVDTSTAHIATALDKPSVLVVGGWAYGEMIPWQRSTRQQWLTNPLPCFKCFNHCLYPSRICVTDISPERVAQKIIEGLQNTAPKKQD